VIYAFKGLPGCGKTLAMIHTMMTLRGTHDIYANFHTRRDLARFSLWPEFLDICKRRSARPRAYFIDEANVWFPSRAWKETTVAELAKFQQHRKHGIDLYWSAQNIKRVDIGIRELTAIEIHVSRLWRFVRLARTTPTEDQQGQPTRLGTTYFFASDEIYNSYWTQEVIGDRFGGGYEWGTSSLYSEPLDCARIETPDEVKYHLGDAFQYLENLRRLYSVEDIDYEPGFLIDGHWFPRVVSSAPSAQVYAQARAEACEARAGQTHSVVVEVVQQPQPKKKGFLFASK
jgi:hypothetical protein